MGLSGRGMLLGLALVLHLASGAGGELSWIVSGAKMLGVGFEGVTGADCFSLRGVFGPSSAGGAWGGELVSSCWGGA